MRDESGAGKQCFWHRSLFLECIDSFLMQTGFENIEVPERPDPYRKSVVFLNGYAA
ncbi:MAG: hypothetical protein ACLR0U_21445 [Enterocloster clostridioformis]